MNFLKTFGVLLFVSIGFTGCSQTKNIVNNNFSQDSIMLRKIYDEALENGRAYDDLRYLCKNIGNRLSGSVGADMAVEWGYKTLKGYNFDTVYLQEIMVPHWERGTKEKGYYTTENGPIQSVHILALGGSIGTDGLLEGEIIMVNSFEELQNIAEEKIQGKIVFLSEHMKQTHVNTFQAYSDNARNRWASPSIAGDKGAKAIIIRSLSLSENNFPNTGVMGYKEGIRKIPAAAISTNDATALENIIERGEKVNFHFEMNCKTFPDKKSHNVIAEIKGKKNPKNIITVGGHLDSWDVGEGAHDDGAGIVHSMEAARILKTLNYQPNNTIRVVFFMNEENGNRGGISYAEAVSETNEKHIYAIESDAGGFTPRGFTLDGNAEQLALLKSFKTLFKPYFIHHLEAGYGGVDINPLKNHYEGIGLFGLAPDPQRYFDIHHNNNDVFENVNKRELHLGVAAVASLIYLLDSKY